MKNKICCSLLFILCLFTVLGLSGCGDSPEKAREELTKLNLKFPDDFFKSVKNNDLVAVKLFLQAHVDPNQLDEQGTTALIEAAHSGKADMVQQLLDGGADVTIRGKIWDQDSSKEEMWLPSQFAYDGGFFDLARKLRVLEQAQASIKTAALGTVPGVYMEIESYLVDLNPPTTNWSTNWWVFDDAGHFVCSGEYGKPDARTLHEGTYKVEGNVVNFSDCKGMEGLAPEALAPCTVVSNGLKNEVFQMIKVSSSVDTQ